MSNDKDFNPFSNSQNSAQGHSSTPDSAPSTNPYSSEGPAAGTFNGNYPTGYGSQTSYPSAYGPGPTAPNPYQGGSTFQGQNPYPSATPYPPVASAPGYQGAMQNPGYQYGNQYGSMGKPPTNGMAVTSLVLGLVGLFLIPAIPSLFALILGIMARNKIKVTGEGGSSLAVGGIITGILGILFGLLLVGLMVFYFWAMGNSVYGGMNWSDF